MKHALVKNDIDGLIVLNKEKDMTSNDCLMKLKKILHIDKIGHIGTLDPNATGVLVCLLGSATKSQEYLMKTGDKVYEAEIIFGIATDTEDVTGNIVKKDFDFLPKNNDKGREVDTLNEKLNNAIKQFVGEYNQIPPMYSAKKINGQKLVNLARNGVNVERKANKVYISDIVVTSVVVEKKMISQEELNVFVGKIIVTCSKGTYIRTLCKDIGCALSTEACMGNLKRVKVFDFDINESYNLRDIEEKIKNDDYSFIKPCYYREGSSVVTFGKFETLHLGHMKIINKVVELAHNNNYKSIALVVGDDLDNEIVTREQRISKFKFLGIDTILRYKLNDVNKKISAEDFVRNILINQMKAKIIVVGSDCSFGYKGVGDGKLLEEICKEYNVEVIIVDKLKIEGTNRDISSTLIKEEYNKGNIDFVNKLIGRKSLIEK